MRAVLDTSVFISAFISPNRPPNRALTLWFEKRYELVTSAWQIDEIRRVSRYERVRPLLSAHDVGRTINALRLRARVVEDAPSVDLSPDPDDNPVIAAALAGRASYLVSGDKGDLLALGTVQGVQIVTARAFVALVG